MAADVFERWAARPAQFDAAQALAQPLQWLDLAPWPGGGAHELVRGRQLGASRHHSTVWACGVTRLPSQWVRPAFSRKVGAVLPDRGAVACILPQLFTELCHASGAIAQPVQIELAARGLLLPSSRRCFQKPAMLPGDKARGFIVLRAELGLIDPAGLESAPAVVRCFAELLRWRFASWWSVGHEPVPIVPQPQYLQPMPAAMPRASRPQSDAVAAALRAQRVKRASLQPDLFG